MECLCFQSAGRRLAIVVAAATFALMLGCATPSSGPPPSESALAAAGFKILTAKTVQQQEHLQTLPAGTITRWQRNGVHYFLYPDVAQKQLYVGTGKEYQAYLKANPGSAPAPLPQEAGDMASYNRQDAAMQLYTTRDLNDPYFFWGFDTLYGGPP